jgi:polyhydroxyalkanoate synthesis regulator phasin
MRQDALRAYLEMALGLTEASRKKASKAVKQALGKGGATAEQLQDLAEELLKTSAANREAMTKLVRSELDRTLSRVGLATADEVSELTARVRQLEAELAQARAAAVPTGPALATAPFEDDEAARITEPVLAPVAEPGASEPLATVTPIASGAGAGARKVAKKAVKKAGPAKSATAPAEADISTAPAPARKAAKKTVAKKAAPAEGAGASGAEAVVSGAADAAPSSPAKKAPGRKATTNRAPAKKAPPKKTPARRSGDGGAGT